MIENDPKTLIIGLDGVPWNRIQKWVNEGELLFINRISDNGIYGILKSTIPSSTCPALPSFYTGKNAGNIGIFDFLKPDGSLVTYKDFEKESTILEQLSEQQFKVLFAGVRLAYPPPRINGLVISTVPGLIDIKKLVYPANRRGEIEGFFPNKDQQKYWRSIIKDPMRYKNNIFQYQLDRLKSKLQVFDTLLQKGNYDLGFLWLDETDVLQHYCWRYEEILLNFFKEVDKELTDFYKKYSYSNLFVISDHGFGTVTEYNFHLNEWLYKEGFLKMKGNLLKRWITKNGYWIVESVISPSMKKKILYILQSVISSKNDKNAELSTNLVITPLNNIPGVDWSETIAHATADKSWGIRIIKENLDRDYEEVREEIIQKLKKLRDPYGRRVIKDAWKGEEIYWGKYQDQIPDVILLKHDRFRVKPSLVGKMFTKIRRDGNHVADHGSARDGIFIAYGPDIKDTGEYIGEIQIYDIAPTILHIYGLHVPEDMDGKVLKDIFKERLDFYNKELIFPKAEEKERLKAKIKKLKLNRKL